ncbi:MAG: stage II sporulation protein M, partial [Clostridia bacterium]|nr:stage II sporulation protein M [Clostridia bacterium]
IFAGGSGCSFIELYIQQFLLFLLLFFMGMTVIGVPFLPLYPLYKGFSLGFLISLAVIISGVRGAIFGTLAFFAQNGLYSILGFFVCYSSARLSVALFESLKGSSKHGSYFREFRRHVACFVLIFPLLAIGSLWEFKLVPVLLSLI